MEVRQLASARQITVLNGNSGQMGILYCIFSLSIKPVLGQQDILSSACKMLNVRLLVLEIKYSFDNFLLRLTVSLGFNPYYLVQVTSLVLQFQLPPWELWAMVTCGGRYLLKYQSIITGFLLSECCLSCTQNSFLFIYLAALR